jgi:ribosomal protein S18 acetylase RimI-like enzyme
MQAEDACLRLGVRALHLETDRTNPRAAALYARHGYVDHGRHLMTKTLGGRAGDSAPL